jgi:hypothetical protein
MLLKSSQIMQDYKVEMELLKKDTKAQFVAKLCIFDKFNKLTTTCSDA